MKRVAKKSKKQNKTEHWLLTLLSETFKDTKAFRGGYYPRLTVLFEAVNCVIGRHLWLLIHSFVKEMEACRYCRIIVDILADGTRPSGR